MPMYVFQNYPRYLEKLFLPAKQVSCFQWDDEDNDVSSLLHLIS